MKKSKLYQQFFYIPKHKKISDRVMKAHMITSVIIILFCLSAITLSAYCFFTVSIASTSNTVKAARFLVDITITDPGGNELMPSSANANGSTLYSLVPGTSYQVTLSADGTATTGFCILTESGSPQKYCTCQLGADQSAAGGRRSSYTFGLIVGEGHTEIGFFPHWGTSNCYAVESDFYLSEDGVLLNFGYVPPPPPEEDTTPEEDSAKGAAGAGDQTAGDSESDSAPADSAPADSAPADSTPADSAPADSTPADSTPADSTSADSAPADSAPADSTPADSAPADSAPADSAPADSTPADSAPASSTPADSTPADSAPASSTPVSSAPADSAPASSTPASSTPGGGESSGSSASSGGGESSGGGDSGSEG